MGYDISLTVPIMYDVDVEVAGMTYNINRLLTETRWVGLKLRDLNGFTANEVSVILADVLIDWAARPEYFRQYEVSDWGSLAACTAWAKEVITKLLNYPTAIVNIT
jgi:hypothetical protein